MNTAENIEAYAGTFYDAIEITTTEGEFRRWVEWEAEKASQEEDSNFLRTHIDDITEQLLKDQKYKFSDIFEKAEEIIQSGQYDAAVALMDDEIREDLHLKLAPCDDLFFLAAYMEKHYDNFGEEFTV